MAVRRWLGRLSKNGMPYMSFVGGCVVTFFILTALTPNNDQLNEREDNQREPVPCVTPVPSLDDRDLESPSELARADGLSDDDQIQSEVVRPPELSAGDRLRKANSLHVKLQSLVGGNQEHPVLDANPSYIARRPPRPLPPLNATLPPASFKRRWTEDPRLADFRKYSLWGNIPSELALNEMEHTQLSVILHSYLDSTNVVCKRKLRLGLVEDGGWEVCDDIEWRPISPCIVYSFGINNDFSFDDDAGRIYGCNVYSFDPTMKNQTTHQRSSRVMFYSLGLGGTSGGPHSTPIGQCFSFSDFRRLLGHIETPIDVVKMDIERSEFSALEAMIDERQLHNIRQLLIEYHVYARHRGGMRKILYLFRKLEQAGFRKFYVTKNASCSREVSGYPVMRTKCYEVHYVNVNFQRKQEQQ